MSEINEDEDEKVPATYEILKPTEEDEKAKSIALEAWVNARREMLFHRPFLGTLALNLELIPVVDHRCATASTDGRRIFFNPGFVLSLPEDQRMTILAHEIWHCALSHFTREAGKIDEHELWNFAIDHEVNSLLKEDEFSIPSGAVLYNELRGESAETIFDKLVSGELEKRGEVIDDHMLDESSSKGKDGWGTCEVCEDGKINVKVDPDFRPRRTDDVWKEWKTKMMAAAQQCKDRGIDMSSYETELDRLFDSKIHWKELLRQFLTPMFGGIRKWLPPNRRYVYKRMYLPSIQKQKQLKVAIAIDTSGSTSGDIVKIFISEVFGILNSFGGYELRLLQCDMEINADDSFDFESPFDSEKFILKGGGGTDFRPVFELIEDEGEEPPELLIYMTDGFGPAPKNGPQYPVIWAVIEGGVKPCPWGEMIELPFEQRGLSF